MKLLGVIFAIFGICLGVYTGFCVMFVGGIVEIIDAVKAPVTDAAIIGWAILKILLASFVGVIIAWIGIALGALCGFSSVKFRYRNRRF